MAINASSDSLRTSESALDLVAATLDAEDCCPPFRFSGLPSQRRNPASQHCEYRERRLQPALEVSVELLRLP